MTLPFNEHEKRFLLAEIIKASNVTTAKLLKFVKDEKIDPKWNEIYMPPARNLKACSEAFQELISGPTDTVRPAASFEPIPQPSRKRRYSATERVPSTTRLLHPKPAANGEPGAVLPSTVDAASKKRGRPSKDELAMRQAQAAARGEVYPPPKPASRKPVAGSHSQAMVTGGLVAGAGAKSSDGNAGPPVPPKKKRGRPSKDAQASKKTEIKTHEAVMEEVGIQSLGEPTPGSDADPLEDMPDGGATLHSLLHFSSHM